MSENREYTVTELREMLEGVQWGSFLKTGEDPYPANRLTIGGVVFQGVVGFHFNELTIAIVAQGQIVALTRVTRNGSVLMKEKQYISIYNAVIDPKNINLGVNPGHGLPWFFGDREELSSKLIIDPREISTQRRLAGVLEEMAAKAQSDLAD